MHVVPTEARDGIRSCGVTGSRQLPDMGATNQMQAFTRAVCALLLSHLSGPTQWLCLIKRKYCLIQYLFFEYPWLLITPYVMSPD